MRGLVLVLLKVEVVDDGGQLRLLGRVAVDADFELTPALVQADEGGLVEGCEALARAGRT